mmetsp:Transcript_31228/g.48929  ORF Transcript_31228/g.48929 Transcript_31228/m.48929 type:complete len:751 (-) Transcript_31228:241-2493(-)
MGEKKKQSPFAQHAPVVAAAAIVPGVLGGSVGLAVLPAIYAAALRSRIFFAYFYAFPAICAVIYALDKGVSDPNLLGGMQVALMPIVVAVAVHYYAVHLAKGWATTMKNEIEAFCNNTSAYLDRKCYKEKKWPVFLYMKSERVLISFTCILKIALAVAYLIFFSIIVGAPKNTMDCAGSNAWGLQFWIWVLFVINVVTEIMYHMAMYMSGNVQGRIPIKASFAMPVLHPTYWQWYFVALYNPTHGIWVPVLVENIRTVAVSFFRMQDKEDNIVSPVMFMIDVVHVLAAVGGNLFGGCNYPHAMLFRQLCIGANNMLAFIMMKLKRWKTWGAANKKMRCRLYFPVGHEEIDCAKRKWQEGITMPEDGGEITFPEGHPANKKKFGPVTYYPELRLSRQESKPDWDSEIPKFIAFTRKTLIPGSWVCVECEQDAGILLAEQPMSTGLQGQFRNIHAMVDAKGVLAYWGDFHGKLYAAKRYKKDPAGGWDMCDIDEINALETEAERSAAKNRYNRLLKPYFQDCLMQEKAHELGRAFNSVENLPVRKIGILRACVMEIQWDEEIPHLYLIEQYLDDNSPFRKFNNNDYVPGQQAVQNTPNMFSLFSYFHTDGKLLVCDIQGKKYTFTDPQFHSSEKESAADDDYEDGELRDWLHSDGGQEMMKRVLLGLHDQKALHSLCNRIWPEKMKKWNEEVEQWKADPDFQELMKEWAAEAKMYQKYFAALNPVLDGGVGTFADMEEDAIDEEALKSKQMN